MRYLLLAFLLLTGCVGMRPECVAHVEALWEEAQRPESEWTSRQRWTLARYSKMPKDRALLVCRRDPGPSTQFIWIVN